MQNKGFVKVFAVLLTLVCVFYLSFSFVTRHYTNKAKEIANGDPRGFSPSNQKGCPGERSSPSGL